MAPVGRALICTGAAVLACAAPASAAPPAPFGLACEPHEGVRFCPGTTQAERVPSWDGVLLDVDVTLPARGDGPWPAITLLNGLGGHKRQLSPTAPSLGNGRAPKIFPNTEHHNNVYFARRGYAILAFSSRGFGDSCGAGGTPAAQLQPPPCDTGFVRLADTRYETRDAQHLLGLLADQGIAKPRRLGATGFSYGGGQALELGYLRNRLRCAASVPAGDPCAGRPNGSYVPWRSPRGKRMEFAAAYGQWFWSDLLASLLPNGRYLDFDPATNDSSLEPLGVEIQSYVRALYGLANLDGYVQAPQPPGSPTAPWDLTTAVALLDAGEPYGANVAAIAAEYARFHGGFGITGRPAPILLESGWNDDVFPPAESLRAYSDIRERFPDVPVSMLLGDYGHGRSANKTRSSLAFNDAASAFFDEYLRGRGRGPAPGSVLAYTSTCPTSGPGAPPDGGPFSARSWAAAHPARFRLRGAAAQTVSSSGGDPRIGQNFDPIPQTNPQGTADPCKTIAETSPAGGTYYERRSPGFTMLGLPAIRAQIATSGSGGQLAGRLWDVDPEGNQRLVTRGVYRLTGDQSGPIVFQLHGNAYRFEPGHTVKLELAPSDAPQFRASNGSFSVRVSDAVIDLPALPRNCRRSVRGTARADRFAGTPERDSYRGGPGRDRIAGAAGRDCLRGGAGNDRISARDGERDRVSCGRGRRDRAIADRRDRVRGCERVRRA